MKKIVSIGLLAGIITTSILADGATSFKKCAGCHGVNGEKVALGKSKVLKEMTKTEIESALTGYQKGTYGGAMKTVMVGQAKSLSGEDIKAIATLIGK